MMQVKKRLAAIDDEIAKGEKEYARLNDIWKHDKLILEVLRNQG